MRYETERLSFSLLALCGDNLASTRQKLAANIRCLADLEARFGNEPDWHGRTSREIIHSTMDDRLSAYQLDADDFQAVVPENGITEPPSEHKQQPQQQQREEQTNPSETLEAATKRWAELCGEQERIISEYDDECRMADQEQPTAILGRTKDYTAAVHEWVRKLADHGALKRLHEEVQLRNAP